MCMIVDANRLADFLADPVREDAAPVRKWLDRGADVLVYSTGGQYGAELDKSPNLKRKLLDYARRGRAKLIQPERLAEDERGLSRRSDLHSNDPHVLALARESRARLLFTSDAGLMADFKTKELIDNPRGKVYSGAANQRLLTKTVCSRA